MVGNSIVKCKKCGKELFYLPNVYSMMVKVLCVDCGRNKPIRTKQRTVAANNFVRAKKGPRPDIHPTYSFKSRTEANFARILVHLRVEWKYEERAFTFDNFGYKTKPFIYIIDFETPNKDFHGCQWIEVKGYMDAKSRNKLRRLKKCYPQDAANTLVVIYSDHNKKDIEFCDKLGYKYIFYNQLTDKYAASIPTWE
jgi:hypothetical protein